MSGSAEWHNKGLKPLSSWMFWSLSKYCPYIGPQIRLIFEIIIIFSYFNRLIDTTEFHEVLLKRFSQKLPFILKKPKSLKSAKQLKISKFTSATGAAICLFLKHPVLRRTKQKRFIQSVEQVSSFCDHHIRRFFWWCKYYYSVNKFYIFFYDDSIIVIPI